MLNSIKKCPVNNAKECIEHQIERFNLKVKKYGVIKDVYKVKIQKRRRFDTISNIYIYIDYQFSLY